MRRLFLQTSNNSPLLVWSGVTPAAAASVCEHWHVRGWLAVGFPLPNFGDCLKFELSGAPKGGGTAEDGLTGKREDDHLLRSGIFPGIKREKSPLFRKREERDVERRRQVFCLRFTWCILEQKQRKDTVKLTRKLLRKRKKSLFFDSLQ